MQRQLLGSQSSKLQIHGGIGSLEEEKRGSLVPVELDSSSSLSAASSSEEEDGEMKAEKVTRSRSKIGRSIHLVPLFTLLCFLILYLCSHEVSDEVLASDGAASGVVIPQGEMPGGVHGGGSRGLAREKTAAELGSLRPLKGDGLLRHRKMGAE
ncbi:hypothetical protein HPP92_020416 [Vanilla planifolia]|uniref:Uncharacterized protein n=1 Tax=Vanilla planifolia TaxID=51239 RepID=A0A835Q0F1_VANPL|nr:hypothetical protein HPP92_020416 [Vanilla planifolia]